MIESDYSLRGRMGTINFKKAIKNAQLIVQKYNVKNLRLSEELLKMRKQESEDKA